MNADISQEAIDRMVALVRNMAEYQYPPLLKSTLNPFGEARAIAALLPAPIDPDAEVILEIVQRHCHAPIYDQFAMGMELLKRGRELAQEQS